MNNTEFETYLGPVNPHPRLMKAIPADIEAIVSNFRADLFAQDQTEVESETE